MIGQRKWGQGNKTRALICFSVSERRSRLPSHNSRWAPPFRHNIKEKRALEIVGRALCSGNSFRAYLGDICLYIIHRNSCNK